MRPRKEQRPMLRIITMNHIKLLCSILAQLAVRVEIKVNQNHLLVVPQERKKLTPQPASMAVYGSFICSHAQSIRQVISSRVQTCDCLASFDHLRQLVFADRVALINTPLSAACRCALEERTVFNFQRFSALPNSNH